MNQYLVAIHHPDNLDPALLEDEQMHRDIDLLNEEMQAADIIVFVGGLQPVSTARSILTQPTGDLTITEGPYLPTSEHIGGFWVLKAASLEDAVEWGRKASIACRTPVEVRPFH